MKQPSPEPLPVYKLGSVFTPASANPALNFVARGEIEEDLGYHLSTIGRPICVEGPFRCGKTSLILKSVKEHYKRAVHVVCNERTSFDDLLTKALDDLAPFYSEVKEGKDTKVSPGVSGEFWFFRGSLGGGGKEKVVKERPVIEPQKTSAAIARFVVAADAAWVIDDAHKLEPSEFKKLAEAMREWQTTVFDDTDAKMVVIASDIGGISATERLIAGAPDLAQRLVSMKLSLMTNEELLQIIKRGEALLNVDMSQIYNPILQYSFGFPGICHDLCAQACHAAKVQKTQTATATINASHLQRGLKKYVEECSHAIKFSFSDMREKSSSLISPAFFTTVLEKVASRDMSDGFAVVSLIEEVATNLGITKDSVARGLEQLMDEAVGVLRLDNSTKVVLFREPLYRAYYIQQSAAESEAIEQDEVVRALLRVLEAT